MVMERGSTFSAGERQLVSFARALYSNPSILVLDEATSNIDTETETLVKDAIGHLTKGRTSIVIAHRLSTIKNADTIIVLDKGAVVEEGRHEELLARRGIYHKLYSLQFHALKSP
jgi:ABC-type multidrug transport system fused ATPase/permease subunit